MTDRAPNVADAAQIVLDITLEHCPMTFVRVRLALDRMQSGDLLAVRLAGDEPARNVPRSAEELGHTVLADEDCGGGVRTLLIRKK